MTPQKFRYYITDIGTGCIFGSNNTEGVKELSASEDYFIVDTETNQWLTVDDTEETIQELI